MSVLPDHQIRRHCRRPKADTTSGLIYPYNEEQLQPASYDVRLGKELLLPTTPTKHPMAPDEYVDLGEPTAEDLYVSYDMDDDGYLLGTSEFVLGVTVERVCIPNGIVGRIEGKSSIGRLALTVHVTAGYLDPGFHGRVTLEIVNLFPHAIRLRPGVLIAQLGFEYMSAPCERPYGSAGLRSRYQGADGVQASRHRRTTDGHE